MNYKDLDRTQKYVNNRAFFVNHKGKEIFITTYNELGGDEYEKQTDYMKKFLLETVQIEGKEILNLCDFTNTKATSKVIQNLLDMAKSFTKVHVKKTAYFGITSLQKVFVRPFSVLGLGDFKVFDTKEDAMNWLVKD